MLAYIRIGYSYHYKKPLLDKKPLRTCTPRIGTPRTKTQDGQKPPADKYPPDKYPP